MEKIITIGGVNTMKKSQKILMNLTLFTSGMVVCAILDRSYLKNSSSAQKLIGAIIVSSIVILSMIFVIKA